MELGKLTDKLKALSCDELNEILNIRDENPFDSEWCYLNNELSGVPSNFRGEDIFTRLSEVTNSNEVCTYIIEDLELIYKAETCGYSSTLLSLLIDSYNNGNIPY